MAIISGFGHPKIFDRSSGTTRIVSGPEAVHDYLRILLLSDHNEFFADPDYGCDLKSLIFNPNDDILIDLVKLSIVKAIQLYFSSIIVTRDDIKIVQNEDSIDITINYIMNDYSNQSVVTLNILNKEVLNG